MMKLGVNSVLFGGLDYETAARCISLAGYDGVELSAIRGMGPHLDLDNNWEAQVEGLLEINDTYGLEFLAMEEAALDRERLIKAFQAAEKLDIPVVNIGPGGESDDEETFEKQTDLMAEMAEEAEKYGVTLCVKAHVGACIYNTPTTLRVMEKIESPFFGIDMDPSHIYRAGEEPEEAVPEVLDRVRHIHIRDCLGRDAGPGEPQMQVCGRGDIDLFAYCQALVEGDYDGPVNLEVIGAGDKMRLEELTAIAAESYGYLNACLKRMKAR